MSNLEIKIRLRISAAMIWLAGKLTLSSMRLSECSGYYLNPVCRELNEPLFPERLKSAIESLESGVTYENAKKILRGRKTQ